MSVFRRTPSPHVTRFQMSIPHTTRVRRTCNEDTLAMMAHENRRTRTSVRFDKWVRSPCENAAKTCLCTSVTEHGFTTTRQRVHRGKTMPATSASSQARWQVFFWHCCVLTDDPQDPRSSLASLSLLTLTMVRILECTGQSSSRLSWH